MKISPRIWTSLTKFVSRSSRGKTHDIMSLIEKLTKLAKYDGNVAELVDPHGYINLTTYAHRALRERAPKTLEVFWSKKGLYEFHCRLANECQQKVDYVFGKGLVPRTDEAYNDIFPGLVKLGEDGVYVHSEVFVNFLLFSDAMFQKWSTETVVWYLENVNAE